MIRLFVLALALAALTACSSAPSAADIARDQAEATRYDLQAARSVALADDMTSAYRVAIWILCGLGVAVAGYVVVHIGTDAYVLVKSASVRASTTLPTIDGRVPIPNELLPAASMAALGAQHARLQLTVTEQALDNTLTFAGGGEVLGRLLEAPTAD